MRTLLKTLVCFSFLLLLAGRAKGADSRAVLVDDLGIPAEEYDALVAGGVVAEVPPGDPDTD